MSCTKKEGISDYNWNANGDEIFGVGGVVDFSLDNFIGRASVENSTEAAVFVNKVINYENLENVNNVNYVDNVLLLGAHIYDPPAKDFTAQANWMNPVYNNFLTNTGTAWRIYDDYNYTSDPDTLLCQSSGLHELLDIEKSMIYPNPASGNFTVDNAKGKRIRMYSLSGRLIHNFVAKNELTSIDVSKLTAGLYLVYVDNVPHKVVIQ